MVVAVYWAHAIGTFILIRLLVGILNDLLGRLA
jgi:hypothetical protein